MKNLAKVLVMVTALAFPSANKIYAQVSVGLSVRIGPPALPVYSQPPCPVDGYLWQPGYWAYDNGDGYYWVPGVWVAPPYAGVLWTPCYWGFSNGLYVYHSGYWGSHVGFYGGINYGYGYPGEGFYGGGWRGRSFRYNTAVFNVNRRVVRNVYVDRRGTGSGGGNRASFNGPGGINRQPRPEERRVMNERHVQPTRSQISHQQMAGRNSSQRFSANHGRPATSAMNRTNSHISAPSHMESRGAGGRGNNPAMHNMQRGNAGRQQNIQRPGVQNREQRMAQPHMQPQRMQQQRGMQKQHISQPRMQPQRMNGGGGQRPQMGGGQPRGAGFGGQPHMGGGGQPRPGGSGGGQPRMSGGGGQPHGGGGQPQMGGGGQPHGGGGGGQPHGGGGDRHH
jgi:hypothetical protein